MLDSDRPETCFLLGALTGGFFRVSEALIVVAGAGGGGEVAELFSANGASFFSLGTLIDSCSDLGGCLGRAPLMKEVGRILFFFCSLRVERGELH